MKLTESQKEEIQQKVKQSGLTGVKALEYAQLLSEDKHKGVKK